MAISILVSPRLAPPSSPGDSHSKDLIFHGCVNVCMLFLLAISICEMDSWLVIRLSLSRIMMTMMVMVMVTVMVMLLVC